jgi:hypothetical protein
MFGFNPIPNSLNTDDNKDDPELKSVFNMSRQSNSSKRTSSPRPNLVTPIAITENEKPTEEDFINFYFKDKDKNENIKRIYEKYMEVKENFEKEKTPNAYIDTNTEPDKQQSSAGWQVIYKDNQTYAYTVDSQKVTLDIEGKTYKDFIVYKEEYATIFMITLEITMQKMAYDIILESETDIIIPKITNHYLLDLKNENYRIIIEMDYIEHKDLEEGKVEKAMEALGILRDHNIYHFDTHKENIVQSVEGDKVVILDFGKSQINDNETRDISSTSGLFKIKDQVNFDYKKWIDKTMPKDHMIRTCVDFYGGKKTKSKRKTRKGKKKNKSKKTKKRTYRKRK